MRDAGYNRSGDLDHQTGATLALWAPVRHCKSSRTVSAQDHQDQPRSNATRAPTATAPWANTGRYTFLDRDGSPFATFEPGPYVWATVMSRPAEDRAIVDAGLKALAFDSGPPLVCDEPATTYERASDEHGRLRISGATNRLGLGDKLRIIPGSESRKPLGVRDGGWPGAPSDVLRTFGRDGKDWVAY